MKPKQTPILYINLASRPDRLSFLTAQLSQLGLTAERIDAVTIDMVPEALVALHADAKLPYRCAVGDLACGLSHVKAWTLALERDYDEVVILEDDAVLHPSFAAFAEPGLLGRLQADMIKLETWRKRVRLGPLREKLGSVELRELLSTQLGCAAYLTNRAAMERSLASPVLNRLTVDQFLFGRGGPHLLASTVLQATPSPVIQLDRLDNSHAIARSDIAANRNAARARAKRTYDHWTVLGIHADHARRIVDLLIRDPQVVREPRGRVPFAGDDAPPAAPGP